MIDVKLPGFFETDRDWSRERPARHGFFYIGYIASLIYNLVSTAGQFDQRIVL